MSDSTLKMRDEFVIAGLHHRRLPARPNVELTGLRKYKFGPIAFDMFGDVAADQLYARSYISESGEVAWFAVTTVGA